MVGDVKAAVVMIAMGLLITFGFFNDVNGVAYFFTTLFGVILTAVGILMAWRITQEHDEE